jgi:hypothetical protein
LAVLASDAPGEALAALYALRRTLAAHKLDLHDLAHTIERAGQLKAAPKNKMPSAT